MSGYNGKFIAHRGLHGQAVPENSLEAFRLAAEKGVAAELDVRLTKDMKLVVFHDESLERMCGVNIRISDLTYSELSEYRLLDSEEGIPLLTDVLRAVDDRVPLLIEIKRGASLWVTEKRLDKLMKSYKGKYSVQSFDPISVLWFRLFAKETHRGQLITENGGRGWKEKFLLRLSARPFVRKFITKPDFISCDLRSITLEKVLSFFDDGFDLYTWTANTPELIESAMVFSKKVIAENFPEDFDFTQR